MRIDHIRVLEEIAMSLAHVEMVANRSPAAVPSLVPLVSKRPLGAIRSCNRGTAFGMVVVAIIPAVFWTGCIWRASSALGLPLSGSTLAIIAVAIAGFLTIIASALMAAR